MTPTSPPRLCTRCGRIGKGRCPNCSGWAAPRAVSDRRAIPTSSSRWRKIRAAVLRAEPLCRSCGALAEEVDHLVPLSEGGDELSGANLQPLCTDCHSRKTRAEAERGKGRGR